MEDCFLSVSCLTSLTSATAIPRVSAAKYFHPPIDLPHGQPGAREEYLSRDRRSTIPVAKISRIGEAYK
jgi:hypothetical protein